MSSCPAYHISHCRGTGARAGSTMHSRYLPDSLYTMQDQVQRSPGHEPVYTVAGITQKQAAPTLPELPAFHNIGNISFGDISGVSKKVH